MVRRQLTIFRRSCCCELANSIQCLAVSGPILLHIQSVILTNAEQGKIIIFSRRVGVVRRPITIFRGRTCYCELANSIQYPAVSGPKKGGGGSSPHNHLSRPVLLLRSIKFHPIPLCKRTALAPSSVCDTNERETG